jgi:signal transduction histidine kinase
VAYASLALGYVSFLWLANLATGRPGPSIWAAIGIAAWMLFLPAVIELARNRRAYAQARRERAIEELRSQHEAVRRQASEERLGIARELHDVLAHSLSLINVQAGVALELMDGRPEQARSALTTIKQASKEALVEVQSVLGSLRRPGEEPPHTPTPTLKDIDELVRRAESAGLTVVLHISGQPVSLPSGVESAAYRIVQEALTNVVRHAHAATVTVQICYGEQELLILVDDDGRGRPTSAAPGSGSGSGSGIVGMRERAVALGGELAAAPKAGGGFRVRARIPLPDQASDGGQGGAQ